MLTGFRPCWKFSIRRISEQRRAAIQEAGIRVPVAARHALILPPSDKVSRLLGSHHCLVAKLLREGHGVLIVIVNIGIDRVDEVGGR